MSYYKATGIITSQQGSGRYIEMPDISKQIANTWRILVRAKPSLLMDFLEVRSILELNSLGKAMQRIDLEQLQYMGEQVRIMKEKAEMGQAFVEQDGEFHKTLFRVTGNVFLEQLLTAFWELFADSPIEKNHEDLPTVAYQHEKILEAFTRQNLPLLEDLMKEQFEDARFRIAKYIQNYH